MADRNLRFLITARNLTARAFRGVIDGLDSVRLKALAVSAAIGGAFAGVVGGSLFKSAIGSAADFEAALDRVQAFSGATVYEMVAIREEAERLGRTTRFTATEVADGFAVLARAGFSARDAIAAIDPVLQTTIAASTDLATAAGLVNNGIQAFGLSAKDAQQVADLLAASANNANTTIENLGFGLGQAGTVARAAGVSITDFTAALALVQGSGVRAETATTALRNVIQELSDPTSDAARAVRELGDTSGDLQTNLNTIANAGDQAEGVVRSFGQEAQLAVRVLTQAPARINDFVAALGEVEGASARTAETIGGNLIGAFAGLGSAIDAAKRFLVDPILQPLQAEIRSLSDAISDFIERGGLDSFRKAIFDAFTEAAASVREFIANFNFEQAAQRASEFTRSVIENFRGVAEFVGTTATAVKTAVNALQAGFNVLGGAFNSVVGNTDAADRSFAALDRNILELRENADSLSQRLGLTAEATVTVGSEAQKTRDRIQELGNAGASTANELKKIEGVLPVYEAVEKSVESLSGTLSVVKAQTGATASDLASSSASAAETADGLAKGEAGATATAEAVRAQAAAADETAQATNRVVEKLEVGKSLAQEMADRLAAARDRTRELSENALEDFNQRLQSIVQRSGQDFFGGIFSTPLSAEVDRATAEIDRLEAELRNIRLERIELPPLGVRAFINSVQQAERETRIAFLEQQRSADRFFEAVEDGSQTAIRATGLTTRSVEQLRRQFDLLDDTTLDRLENELNRIEERTRQLGDTLQRELIDKQRELAQLAGDDLALAQIEGEQELLRLQELRRQAETDGNRELLRQADELLTRQREINRIREQEAREQQRSRQQTNADNGPVASDRSGGGGVDRSGVESLDAARESAHKAELARIAERERAEARAADSVVQDLQRIADETDRVAQRGGLFGNRRAPINDDTVRQLTRQQRNLTRLGG